MKEIIFTLILGIILIMATRQDENYIVHQVYSVDSLEVLKTADNEIVLKTISMVPNPCYQFSHIETEQSGAKILVTVFAKKEKNVNCISIIGKMETELKLPVSKTGEYKIIFLGKTKNNEILLHVKE